MGALTVLSIWDTAKLIDFFDIFKKTVGKKGRW